MAGTMGTGGSTSVSIYTGSQPANADAATSGTLLCTIIGIGWGGTTGDASTVGCIAGTIGLACSAAGISGTAATSGTAGWARMITIGTGFTGSAATFRIDGDVGTGGASTFVINSVAITALGTVTLLTAPISIA